ncbi:MAG TPA: hypothetical protein VGP76_27635 [Planctomycetaceae bacterium]|jgi:hypothetical protein|nr:hypothetical protein [Planctomycetaceae bacterium]
MPANRPFARSTHPRIINGRIDGTQAPIGGTTTPMVGSRDKNLRSGHIHESFGLELLRRASLVAPVPPTEDVGLDAFCTLIRPGSGRRLIAEDSFGVQIKAKSERIVKYDTAVEVSWLNQLDIPWFLASVDLNESTIVLYATHRVTQLGIEKVPHKNIHLCLKSLPTISKTSNARQITLGTPVCSWSNTDVRSETFARNVYEVLKSHVVAQKRNLQNRLLGVYEDVQWQTGTPATMSGTRMMMGSSAEANMTLYESMVHPLAAILLDICAKKRFNEVPLIVALFDMLRRRGVDPDPGGLTQMACMLADGDSISEEQIVQLRSMVIPRRLDLTRTRITDTALKHIPISTELLSLAGTKITDEGLASLVAIPHLKRLNVSGTHITDRGLSVLRDCPDLEWLCVKDTDVTRQGVNRFKTRRPGTVIDS